MQNKINNKNSSRYYHLTHFSDFSSSQSIFSAVVFYMKHLGVKTRAVDSKKSRGGFFKRQLGKVDIPMLLVKPDKQISSQTGHGTTLFSLSLCRMGFAFLHPLVWCKLLIFNLTFLTPYLWYFFRIRRKNPQRPSPEGCFLESPAGLQAVVCIGLCAFITLDLYYTVPL